MINNDLYTSIDKTRVFLKDISRGRIDISNGFICIFQSSFRSVHRKNVTGSFKTSRQRMCFIRISRLDGPEVNSLQSLLRQQATGQSSTRGVLRKVMKG